MNLDLLDFLAIAQNLVLLVPNQQLVLGSSFGLQNASEVQIVYVTGRQWVILVMQICSIVLVL